MALLEACGLPHQDIGPHLPHFTVARDGGRLVGVIGLEVHGQEALLRSLAVAPDRRGRGIARRLYATVIGQAQRLGLDRLYLLTTTADAFFEMLGFSSVPRESVPQAIREAREFGGLGPGSAVCMLRTVPR